LMAVQAWEEPFQNSNYLLNLLNFP
jgi:hypothetical protein